MSYHFLGLFNCNWHEQTLHADGLNGKQCYFKSMFIWKANSNKEYICNGVFRVQGAFLCHIRPAFLLDIQEFKHWCSLQVEFFMLRLHHVLHVLHTLNAGDGSVLNAWISLLPTHLYTLLLSQVNEEENSFDYSCVDYESLSKRSWTDVLLQTYKVENPILCPLSFWVPPLTIPLHMSRCWCCLVCHRAT